LKKELKDKKTDTLGTGDQTNKSRDYRGKEEIAFDTHSK
jgi:hypothetical protein